MPAPPNAKILGVVRAVAACVIVPLAVAHVAVLAWILTKRIAYPMDLEWLEGQQIYEAYRFIHGLPVYGPPTQGFVPSPYPPLHFMTMGLVGLVVGLDYWSARFVSDASIVAVFVMQGFVFRRVTANQWLALVLAIIAAAGLNVAFPSLCGSLDFARADSLAFALVAGAATLVGRARRTWGAVIGLSVLLVSAVYTKQNNVLYDAWLILWIARRDFRHAVRVTLVSSVLGGVALAALQLWTHGWFWTWITEMSHHPFVLAKWKSGTTYAITGAPPLVVVPILAGILAWRRALRDESKLWLGMLAMAVPACGVPYLADGGGVNNLIAICALGWFVSVLLVNDLVVSLEPRPTIAASATLAAAAAYAIVMGMQWHDPSPLVPGADRTRDAEAMHALIRGLDGDVLLPMYPFVVPRDGKTTPQPAVIPYLDAVMRGGVKVDMAATFRDVRAKWVILPGHDLEDGLMKQWLGADYVVDREVPIRVQAFAEQTGHTMIVLRRVDASVSVTVGGGSPDDLDGRPPRIRVE